MLQVYLIYYNVSLKTESFTLYIASKSYSPVLRETQSERRYNPVLNESQYEGEGGSWSVLQEP